MNDVGADGRVEQAQGKKTKKEKSDKCLHSHFHSGCENVDGKERIENDEDGDSSDSSGEGG